MSTYFRHLHLMNKKLLCITFLLLIYSCVNDEPDDSLTEITIDQAELILSAEKDDEIARPSTFRVTTDGFCLYDFGLHKILCYDENGNRQLMFGKEGQGPGEFQGLAGFWIFDELITAFDQQGAKLLYYDHDGSFLREENLEQENFAPGLTMIGPEQLFIPLNGKDGKLAAYFDNKSGERFSFGGADLEESEFDASEISQSIERGTLPDFMLGRVMIAAGENHV